MESPAAIFGAHWDHEATLHSSGTADPAVCAGVSPAMGFGGEAPQRQARRLPHYFPVHGKNIRNFDHALWRVAIRSARNAAAGCESARAQKAVSLLDEGCESNHISRPFLLYRFIVLY